MGALKCWTESPNQRLIVSLMDTETCSHCSSYHPENNNRKSYWLLGSQGISDWSSYWCYSNLFFSGWQVEWSLSISVFLMEVLRCWFALSIQHLSTPIESGRKCLRSWLCMLHEWVGGAGIFELFVAVQEWQDLERKSLYEIPVPVPWWNTDEFHLKKNGKMKRRKDSCSRTCTWKDAYCPQPCLPERGEKRRRAACICPIWDSDNWLLAAALRSTHLTGLVGWLAVE